MTTVILGGTDGTWTAGPLCRALFAVRSSFSAGSCGSDGVASNAVSFFLEAEGFEVIDLGVDVPPEKFVESVRNEKPDILAISALITLTMPEVSNTMKALEKANLRDEVKVIVGGAPITQEFIDDIGADALAKNAIDGVKKCKGWVGL